MSTLPVLNKLQVESLLTTFLDSKGQATRAAYRSDLDCFQTFLNQFSIPSIEGVVSLSQGEVNLVVLKYRDNLLDLKLSPATVNRRLGAVRSLFKLARMIGVSTVQVEIPNLKSEQYRDTKGPGLLAFKNMMSHANKQSCEKAARDHAILRLMFDLALRASELVELDLCHIELDQKRVSIKGKGRMQRQFLSLPPTSVSAVSDWLIVRGNAQGPLFFNLVRSKNNRQRLSRTGLYDLVKAIGLKVGVRTRPHGLRHLSITEACKAAQNNGYNLEEVLDHSRHKSVSTLMIYRDRERDVQGVIATLVSNTIVEED